MQPIWRIFLAMIKERLKKERDRLGLSQAEAAKLCGIQRQYLSKIERGEAPLNIERLSELAKHGFDAQFILTGISSDNAEDVTAVYSGGMLPDSLDYLARHLSEKQKDMLRQIIADMEQARQDRALAKDLAAQLKEQ